MKFEQIPAYQQLPACNSYVVQLACLAHAGSLLPSIHGYSCRPLLAIPANGMHHVHNRHPH